MYTGNYVLLGLYTWIPSYRVERCIISQRAQDTVRGTGADVDEPVRSRPEWTNLLFSMLLATVRQIYLPVSSA